MTSLSEVTKDVQPQDFLPRLVSLQLDRASRVGWKKKEDLILTLPSSFTSPTPLFSFLHEGWDAASGFGTPRFQELQALVQSVWMGSSRRYHSLLPLDRITNISIIYRCAQFFLIFLIPSHRQYCSIIWSLLGIVCEEAKGDLALSSMPLSLFSPLDSLSSNPSTTIYSVFYFRLSPARETASLHLFNELLRKRQESWNRKLTTWTSITSRSSHPNHLLSWVASKVSPHEMSIEENQDSNLDIPLPYFCGKVSVAEVECWVQQWLVLYLYFEHKAYLRGLRDRDWSPMERTES